MRRALVALSLLAAGYLAGTVAPRAQAGNSLDSFREIVSELRGIRSELTQLRRAVEKMK